MALYCKKCKGRIIPNLKESLKYIKDQFFIGKRMGKQEKICNCKKEGD